MDEALAGDLRVHDHNQLVAIPGTDGRLQAALGRLGELLGLVVAENDKEPNHRAG